jgi:hypothetical protein
MAAGQNCQDVIRTKRTKFKSAGADENPDVNTPLGVFRPFRPGVGRNSDEMDEIQQHSDRKSIMTVVLSWREDYSPPCGIRCTMCRRPSQPPFVRYMAERDILICEECCLRYGEGLARDIRDIATRRQRKKAIERAMSVTSGRVQ